MYVGVVGSNSDIGVPVSGTDMWSVGVGRFIAEGLWNSVLSVSMCRCRPGVDSRLNSSAYNKGDRGAACNLYNYHEVFIKQKSMSKLSDCTPWYTIYLTAEF